MAAFLTKHNFEHSFDLAIQFRGRSASIFTKQIFRRRMVFGEHISFEKYSRSMAFYSNTIRWPFDNYFLRNECTKRFNDLIKAAPAHGQPDYVKLHFKIFGIFVSYISIRCVRASCAAQNNTKLLTLLDARFAY